MKSKFFKNKVEPSCAYCKFGRVDSNEEKVFCQKKGITNVNDFCKAFSYDPLKRVPKAIVFSTDLTEKDFEI